MILKSLGASRQACRSEPGLSLSAWLRRSIYRAIAPRLKFHEIAGGDRLGDDLFQRATVVHLLKALGLR